MNVIDIYWMIKTNKQKLDDLRELLNRCEKLREENLKLREENIRLTIHAKQCESEATLLAYHIVENCTERQGIDTTKFFDPLSVHTLLDMKATRLRAKKFVDLFWTSDWMGIFKKLGLYD